MKKTYEIRYAPTFSKDFKNLERASQIKILNEINILRTNPFAGKPLRGDWKGVYSLRIGKYRLLYSIKETQINLLFIGHRSHIYE